MEEISKNIRTCILWCEGSILSIIVFFWDAFAAKQQIGMGCERWHRSGPLRGRLGWSGCHHRRSLCRYNITCTLRSVAHSLPFLEGGLCLIFQIALFVIGAAGTNFFALLSRQTMLTLVLRFWKEHLMEGRRCCSTRTCHDFQKFSSYRDYRFLLQTHLSR